MTNVVDEVPRQGTALQGCGKSLFFRGSELLAPT
jgi:hypothetical protein